jgi:hypothetical protein
MAFSWVALDGLRKLGLVLTDADQEAYLHSWRVVGQMLGIQLEMLPKDMNDAAMLVQAIVRREFGASPEGKEMTTALTNMLVQVIPGNVFQAVPRLLIRYFLGKQWAEWLAVEDCPLMDAIAGPLQLLGLDRSSLLNESAAARALAQKVGRLLVSSLVYVERGGNRPAFSIPAELKQQWGVNWLS